MRRPAAASPSPPTRRRKWSTLDVIEHYRRFDDERLDAEGRSDRVGSSADGGRSPEGPGRSAGLDASSTTPVWLPRSEADWYDQWGESSYERALGHEQALRRARQALQDRQNFEEGAGPDLVRDRLAWYRSVRFWGPDWGFYITRAGVEILAGQSIAFDWESDRTRWQMDSHLWAAFLELLFHEAFHHCVESAAIRLDLDEGPLPGRRDHYAVYTRDVYEPALRSSGPLEEALAVAAEFRWTLGGAALGLATVAPDWDGPLLPRVAAVLEPLRRRLHDSLPGLSAGYRDGGRFLRPGDFADGRSTLLRQMRSRVTRHLPPGEQQQLFDPICDLEGRVFLVD